MTTTHRRSIRYTSTDSPLGPLLLAATERGVCHVRFADDPPDLEKGLAEEFPFAVLERDDTGLAPYVEALDRYIAGRSVTLGLPLDVRGSRFQRLVWDALRRIPRGETRTYGAIAAALGRPHATRAVARACAANPVAVVVPCHRVVGKRDGLGGYRWGLERKRRLLDLETR